jgi:hypothetical protein
MTYKDLVDRLLVIINSHAMVETTGYGNLSDIEVPDNEEPPNYPYVFINPVNISNGRREFNLTLNMICMTQVVDEEQYEINGQSICIGIIQDVVSQFLMTNQDPLIDVVTPFTITPFKERFQDDVVGATATLVINYGKAIDGCLVPLV